MIPWLFHPRQCAQAGDNPVDDESTIAEDFTGSLDKPHTFWPESASTRTISRSLVQSSTEIVMLGTQAELRKHTSSTLFPWTYDDYEQDLTRQYRTRFATPQRTTPGSHVPAFRGRRLKHSSPSDPCRVPD
jgi:hypothetical protein